jgi:hypothetical protein
VTFPKHPTSDYGARENREQKKLLRAKQEKEAFWRILLGMMMLRMDIMEVVKIVGIYSHSSLASRHFSYYAN